MTATKRAATAAKKAKTRVWVIYHLIRSEAIKGATRGGGARPLPEALRIAANELKAALDEASAFTAKLIADGWAAGIVTSSCAASYYLVLEHPLVTTKEQAAGRLRKLGLDADSFDFDECDADELIPAFMTF